MNATPPPPPPPLGAKKEPRWSGWKAWLTAGLGLVALILVVQNSQKVEVDFIFASTNTPLFFALLITLGIGIGIGWLLPRIRARGDK